MATSGDFSMATDIGGLFVGLVVASVVWVVWVVMAWGPFETRTWRASWLGEY